MALIRSKNTKPEITVRKALHAAGFRFRLHKKELPGKPDIVLSSRSIVIFVHGCFWHGHSGCKRNRIPKTRTNWWREKIEENIRRDQRKEEELRGLGWTVITIWECEINDSVTLPKLLERIRTTPRHDR